MKKILVLSAIFFILPASWAFASIASAPATFARDAKMFFKMKQDITAMVEAATVWVVIRCDNILSGGSGFIVGDGYIATNAHVVDVSGEDVSIYVLNELIPMQKASVIKMLHEGEESSSVDLAILRFDPPKGIGIPILPLNFSANINCRVSAWGYPQTMVEKKGNIGKLGKLQAITAVHAEGTINGIEKLSGKPGCHIIKYSIPLEEGYSGGPLVNENGEVLGMNTWCRRNKEDNKYLWSEAQAAANIAYFLQDNGITPKLAPGQRIPPPTKSRTR